MLHTCTRSAPDIVAETCQPPLGVYGKVSVCSKKLCMNHCGKMSCLYVNGQIQHRGKREAAICNWKAGKFVSRDLSLRQDFSSRVRFGLFQSLSHPGDTGNKLLIQSPHYSCLDSALQDLHINPVSSTRCYTCITCLHYVCMYTLAVAL